MPTGAVLLLRVRGVSARDNPNFWRRDLVAKFDPADFSSDGPLTVLGSRKWDRDPPVVGKGKWFDVGVAVEYYGAGYERGDARWIVGLAEWLERRIEGAEVWYGYDSADESIRPFGPHQRAVLMADYEKVGNEPCDARHPQS